MISERAESGTDPVVQAAIVSLDAAGRRQWKDAFDRHPGLDIYYHPGYADLYQRNRDGEARCLIVEQGRNVLLYPFLVRSIPADLLAEAGLGVGRTDVITPYGYGGPMVVAAPGELPALQARARDVLRREFAALGVVSEFIRFHPVIANHVGESDRVVTEARSRTIVFDLTQDGDALWEGMQATCRNKVRRARREGVVMEEDPEFRHLDAFYDNYIATMARARASDGFRYARRFFEDTISLLEGNVTLFVARQGSRVVNAALVLHRGERAHYHYSGSHPEVRVTGANNLLLHEAALWAKARGMRSFHLGGGRRPDDSLFRFKASLSPAQLDFHVGSGVHEEGAFERLVAAADRRRGGVRPDASFFPPYRA